MSPRGLLWMAAWEGTRDGGAFEAPWVMVSEHDASGTVVRFDQYDLDQMYAALARFAELGDDPLRIPRTAATRTDDRWVRLYEARDWDAIRAICSPALVMDDRRRGILLTGDLEMFLDSSRWMGAHEGILVKHTVLATAGERLVLDQIHYIKRDGALTLMEVNTLEVHEIDAEGRLVALVIFDPDDRRAAAIEMRERFAPSEEARLLPRALFEFLRAGNARDTAAMRAALPDDFVFDDRRRTGVGRIEGADDYIASITPVWETTAEVTVEMLHWIAVEPHGTFGVGRHFGLLRDGGEFETVYAMLILFEGERLLAFELFEPENLETARARFEALRPTPTPAQPATRQSTSGSQTPPPAPG